jgi:hypothetical protein
MSLARYIDRFMPVVLLVLGLLPAGAFLVV